MASYQPVNRHSYLSIISTYQEAPAPESFPSSFFASGSHLAMISVMYVLPISMLMTLCLGTKLRQKCQVRREIRRVQEITRLERIWQLKVTQKIDKKATPENTEDCSG